MPPRPAPPVLWWTRDFRGDTSQVREVRHWIEDLLPDCDPLADLLLLTSELCTNAIVHTRSGEAGGRFSVDVEWSPASVRAVIGDQGSSRAPVAGPQACDTDWRAESGRGLQLVNELADDWGMTSRAGRRWVWLDIMWRANGGPLLEAPGGMDAACTGIAAIRRAFPGTTVWWGSLTRAWWAAIPGAIDASDLVSSTTRNGLSRALALAYPVAAQSSPVCHPVPAVS